MKRVSLLPLILLLAASAAAYGQTAAPAAAPKSAATAASTGPGAPARLAVIDFNQAVVENAEGKTAYGKFQEAVAEKQKGFTEKQKSLEDLQNKLKAGDKTLNDDAKANYTRQIDALNTDLTRMNEDAQRDLGDLQQRLFAPIAGRVRSVMETYAKEMGFALVLDKSSQNTDLVWSDPVADITTEVIRRVDAEAARNPTPAAKAPASAAPKPPSPTAGAPKPPSPKPPSPTAPKTNPEK